MVSMKEHSGRADGERFSALRREYSLKTLDITEIDPDPLRQFTTWLDDAASRGLVEPNAMILATVSSDGKPSARAVLLKGYDKQGFVFFSNGGSRKGREMAQNPAVALLFVWAELERQIRIEGRVEAVSSAESDEYFQLRPRGAQLGAHASDQSAPIANRAALEEQMRVVEARYPTGPIPRPESWGGFRVVPAMYEFWQGRSNRLHDRIVFSRVGGGWELTRLQP
jgi:pyridoxamine 5'-phosphate oxidase